MSVDKMRIFLTTDTVLLWTGWPTSEGWPIAHLLYTALPVEKKNSG
jgi:hypothetical protein